MMRLAALQREAVHSSACKIDWTTGGDEVAFHLTPRPKAVEHSTPRLLRISSIVRRAVLANHESRCSLGELDVDNVLGAP